MNSITVAFLLLTAAVPQAERVLTFSALRYAASREKARRSLLLLLWFIFFFFGSISTSQPPRKRMLYWGHIDRGFSYSTIRHTPIG
jgi:hypothetical protein